MTATSAVPTLKETVWHQLITGVTRPLEVLDGIDAIFDAATDDDAEAAAVGCHRAFVDPARREMLVAAMARALRVAAREIGASR